MRSGAEENISLCSALNGPSSYQLELFQQKKNDTLNRTLSRVAVFIDNMQMILDFSVDISETLFYAKVDSCAIHMTLFRCGA